VPRSANTILQMSKVFGFAGGLAAAILMLGLCGCGVFYQAGTRYRAARMSQALKPGEPMLEVHRRWGEPDLREYPSDSVEIWSYPYKTNTNDVAAALLYTSSKEGDQGTFLDLTFVNGKLVSWDEKKHTMPAKEHGGFGASIGSPTIAGPGTTTHY
jgi:hypothetical protein